MTVIDRLNATCRLGEAYILLNKLEQLDDTNAAMAREELEYAIKDAEKILYQKRSTKNIRKLQSLSSKGSVERSMYDQTSAWDAMVNCITNYQKYGIIFYRTSY